MALRSRVFPLLALAATAPTGCITGTWPSSPRPVRTQPEPAEFAPPSKSTKTTKFADVLRIPGQQVPLNGDWPVEKPLELPDAARPDTPPVKAAQPVPIPDPPLVAALREVLAGRSGAEYLRQLDPASYEHLAQLLPAVAKLAQVPPTQLEPKDAADILKQFDPTLAVVARRAPLRVEKAVFCREVKGYGKYDPLPDGVAFHPRQLYYMYFEVGNVPNEPDGRAGPDGYATRLTCAVQVKDDAGRAVELTDHASKTAEPLLSKDKVNFSRSPVRDYYAVFWFNAPSKPGTYSVTFEVRDPATGRAVSRSLPFRVQ